MHLIQAMECVLEQTTGRDGSKITFRARRGFTGSWSAILILSLEPLHHETAESGANCSWRNKISAFLVVIEILSQHCSQAFVQPAPPSIRMGVVMMGQEIVRPGSRLKASKHILALCNHSSKQVVI